MALPNLSVRLRARRREEALAAIQEAVGIYQELAPARPDAFRPDLASSLNNLTADLGAWGGEFRRTLAQQNGPFCACL
jgi:hypothetical protein